MNSPSQNGYILDTGFFIIAREYYPDTFPSFWVKMSAAAKEGVISSVHEVREEIKAHGGEQQRLLDWINENKNIFDFPSEAEQNRIVRIMNDFRHIVSEKTQQEKKPWADPIVIARAWERGATVVTTERSAKDDHGNVQNPQKIPDICDELEVRCINPQKFLAEQKWSF